jgi:hypothetical protein
MSPSGAVRSRHAAVPRAKEASRAIASRRTGRDMVLLLIGSGDMFGPDGGTSRKGGSSVSAFLGHRMSFLGHLC